MDDLSSKSINQVVITGHCLALGSENLLQGGTGYFLSRNAAYAMQQSFVDLIRIINKWEDWVIYTIFLKAVGSVENTHSHRFIGHGIENADKNKILQKEYTFNKCPTHPLNKDSIRNCVSKFYKLEEVVFYHNLWGYVSQNDWHKIVNNIPEHAMWHQEWSAHICIL